MANTDSKPKLTPLMAQYQEIKAQYPDSIVLFRLGDFYEMFYDDALTAAPVLEITLTTKNFGDEKGKAPLCGVPYHALNQYLPKLVNAGYKVAICEQVEDPKLVKGIVKREVIRVVTPGTLTDESMLASSANNWLAAISVGDEDAAICYADISTGDISIASFSAPAHLDKLLAEITRIAPSELIIVASDNGFFAAFDVPVSTIELGEKECNKANRLIAGALGTSAIQSFGISERPRARQALQALFVFLDTNLLTGFDHFKAPVFYEQSEHMILDRASIRNLELTESIYDRDVKGSLLSVLDYTKTAMGGRLMKTWLKAPLIGISEIQRRQDAVEAISGNVYLRNNIREHLKHVYDLERLAGRIAIGNANARDLQALAQSVSCIGDVLAEISEEADPLISELYSATDSLDDVFTLIDSAIADDLPLTIKDGGIIREGYSEQLDTLKDSISGGQKWIAELETVERERTGIKSLKVGFNRVFGYFIDVTNSNRHLVPEDYIRKQTLVNSERYITPELKSVESEVLGAEAKINELEYRLFVELRQRLLAEIQRIQRTAASLAILDVLVSFAEASVRNDYSKPKVHDGDTIEIRRGRHPVIELTLDGRSFVPNDVYVDEDKRSLLLITGPNMAGKSTYMRMTALIVIMAQAGCFVPAEWASIGVCDRLYTRIGASDNLARGESTFYVEMSELAYILNTATPSSLVILDEIGRGTSTYDGLAIAWAVCEKLCSASPRIRTLFATHYHELSMLEGDLEGIHNLNTLISESPEGIVFLHQIAEGSADHSYGIHVAQLAGVPQDLIENARLKLEQLEEGRSDATMTHRKDEIVGQARNDAAMEDSGDIPRRGVSPSVQLSLFENIPANVVQTLQNLDLLNITPSQAIAILEELKAEVDEK